MNEVLEVIFVSVWDGGYEIETSAKYNTLTRTVYDIEVAAGIDEDEDEVQVLDEEYILLPNGEKLNVSEYNGEYRTSH